ncbi:MAG: hypothetical protein OXI46_08690 [Gemmatimonadota bacterium]|nr:hypothetical protein [Gemmatimonadota bacterium]
MWLVARVNLLLALVLTTFVAACSQAGAGASLFGEAAPNTMIRIEVTNLNFLDATLHAFRNRDRVRLGIVTGKTSAVYTLEWRTPLSLQIEIDLLAGGKCATREVVAQPGDEFILQIPSEFRRMADCLWRPG